MKYTRYVYSLQEESFYQLLTEYTKGVEILDRKDDKVIFAVYEKLEHLEPLQVQEIRMKHPKSYLKTIRVKDFLIVPCGVKTIFINPGMAFGTGLHASTQICLLLIDEFFKKGWTAIDVGCGSGILSIALEKLGAKEVLAIDIDQIAVRECKKNAKANNTHIKCIKARPQDIRERFDFLCANLEMDIFRKEMEHIKRLFKKRAVFSGIYGKDELDEFLQMLKGFRIVKIKKVKGWFGLVVEI
ncbi:50S ribosomal protein L11 methyltransferase [Hydrogenobacter hydrogenophilus]|uniref:[LSU ribosomal protein L11P]-lysine N-methyltransferase n=1 Tax=Hydrogenobacter hydrogenophilus TaxID=35835 RepID=A0A285NPE2_9AQUI|nr:50S ribosomal protein L11 methyltransferase [Hydrogenobacter hydrogenophilus]SNZ11382.1 [LSU ribosomal protein L11P]-lysine N-methyltransferase [Hydrogenobacter hydrogenophilus]